jgi:Carboxypeptidase regulatory-like domain
MFYCSQLNQKKAPMRSLVISLVSCLLVACGGGGGGAPEANTPQSQAAANYSITGAVTAPDGSTIPGVQLDLSGASASSTISNANGAYTFTGLANGIYVVTPSAAGMVFSPASTSVTLQNQSIGSIQFSRTPIIYASTQLIAAYMATLHAQSITTFAGNESALSARLSAQGLYLSGTHYSQSSTGFVAVVQGFANDSLAFINLKSQTLPIDKNAIAALFSTYAAQDAAFANTYYRGVNWGLAAGSLGTFVADINKKTNDLYALIILQLP